MTFCLNTQHKLSSMLKRINYITRPILAFNLSISLRQSVLCYQSLNQSWVLPNNYSIYRISFVHTLETSISINLFIKFNILCLDLLHLYVSSCDISKSVCMVQNCVMTEFHNVCVLIIQWCFTKIIYYWNTWLSFVLFNMVIYDYLNSNTIMVMWQTAAEF